MGNQVGPWDIAPPIAAGPWLDSPFPLRQRATANNIGSLGVFKAVLVHAVGRA
jgi:hypothetical protein